MNTASALDLLPGMPYLRDAEEADLEDINRVVAAAIRRWGLAERVFRLSLPVLSYRALDLELLSGAVVDREGVLVAAALWEPANAGDPPVGFTGLHLHGLYVTPRAQRQGFGTLLVEHVVDEARRGGFGGVVVKAWRKAESFFLEQDFGPVDERDDPDLHPRRLWRRT